MQPVTGESTSGRCRPRHQACLVNAIVAPSAVTLHAGWATSGSARREAGSIWPDQSNRPDQMKLVGLNRQEARPNFGAGYRPTRTSADPRAPRR